MRGIGAVGRDLVNLMDAQEHRGADSTGFAVYGPPRDVGYVLRGIGFDKIQMDADLADFTNILRDHGSDLLSDPKIVQDANKHYCFRVEIKDPTDLAAWVADADELTDRIEIQSCGRSLEIIKDMGGSAEVAEKHSVHDMQGTHGLGHARLATESSVLPNASHPFWARPFSDVAIVHNGQITNYWIMRREMERKGHRFMSNCDSELLAVYTAHNLANGITLEQSLRNSIEEIDGVFTYLVATKDQLGMAKDTMAAKPLVLYESDDLIAMASEEVAIRAILPQEIDTYDPYDEEVRVWQA